MVGHGRSSASSYLADPTSPIPSHCASIVVTSTLRVKPIGLKILLSACISDLSLSLTVPICSIKKTLMQMVHKINTYIYHQSSDPYHHSHPIPRPALKQNSYVSKNVKLQQADFLINISDILKTLSHKC